VTYATLCGPCRIRSTRNVIYNFYLYRHWRHLQKGKKVRKSIKEKYIGQQVLRAVIADVSGIANIADIADIVNIQILRWKQVGAYEVLPRCPVTERSSQNRRCGGFGRYKVVAELLQTIRENKWKG
jgi:hypothetical protein